MEVIFNELVIDDPVVMKLDHPAKIAFLFDCIRTVQLDLAQEFPDEAHFVFVRVGNE